ncbi:Hypothetical protein SCF082_LOCUS13226 [Durusdinium trenchii]|uniref:Uncharacterized protein n=1 Tax=Durusdinium trenchii TaxID=1381693 RepID=A0ABP0JR52_9DINO
MEPDELWRQVQFVWSRPSRVRFNANCLDPESDYELSIGPEPQSPTSPVSTESASYEPVAHMAWDLDRREQVEINLDDSNETDSEVCPDRNAQPSSSGVLPISLQIDPNERTTMGKKHRKAVLEGIDRLNHQDALVKSSIGLKDVPVSEPPTLVITSHPRLFQELQAADGVADVFDVGVGAENLNPEEDSKIWYDVLQDYKNIVIAIGYEQSTDSLRHGKILGNEHGRNVRPRVAEPESERGKKVLKSIHYESDMLDRLERRALGAGELQQVMVLDARLEKWTQIQCDQHRAAVRTELTRRFEEQLALQQQQQQEQLMDSEASDESAQAAQVERSRELTAQIQRLQRVNVARLDEDAVLRHVQELSRAEADLEQIQVDLVAAASTRRPRGPPPPPPTPVAPEGAEQIRRHLEELMQREVQDLGTEEAVRHFEDIAQLHQRVQVAESAAALDSGRRELFDEGSFAVATAAPRAPWPLAMQLESPTPWPTARMRKREQILIRERRREALLVREEFEGRMRDLEQARELERERRKEMEWLVRQAEVERQQQERLAEERRRRAQELDELARTAVSQMVGRQGCARMCRRCRAGPIMNDACSNLATHNRDGHRRRVNHCPRCGWFDRNWHHWPEWDGIYGPH